MVIGEKIWYTWALIGIVCCLTGWMIDEHEHPRIVNILMAVILIPIGIALIAMFVWVLWKIWR